MFLFDAIFNIKADNTLRTKDLLPHLKFIVIYRTYMLLIPKSRMDEKMCNKLNLPLLPKHKNGLMHWDEYLHMLKMTKSWFLEEVLFPVLQSTLLCSLNGWANLYEQPNDQKNFD